MLDTLRRLGTGLIDLLLPRRCAACENAWLLAGETFWCAACLNDLQWIDCPKCPLCGRPYLDSPASSDHLCGDCRLSTPPFDSARSATLYTDVVREGIHQLKFGGRLHWVPPLADLLCRLLEREGTPEADFILPVPLHTERVKERGFNQSGLLARALGQRIGLEVRHDLLIRRQWTTPQTRLDRKERLRNVKGAFGLSPEGGQVAGSRIILIDDVFTTGTTISECSRELKRHKAAEVHVLTVARVAPEQIRMPVGDQPKGD